MNTIWANKNKEFQVKIKSKATFAEGIKCLLELRELLIQEILNYKTILEYKDYLAMPFATLKGYDSKPIAYSLYHMTRIEDIVANILILKKQDILIKANYDNTLRIDIITTGNELTLKEISQCFQSIDIEILYKYIIEVITNTNKLIKSLTYEDLKTRFTGEDKDTLIKAKVVSTNENAFWLIDYWSNKDLKGLLQMPFSRHLIMHIEACNRIISKLK